MKKISVLYLSNYTGYGRSHIVGHSAFDMILENSLDNTDYRQDLVLANFNEIKLMYIYCKGNCTTPVLIPFIKMLEDQYGDIIDL